MFAYLCVYVFVYKEPKNLLINPFDRNNVLSKSHFKTGPILVGFFKCCVLVVSKLAIDILIKETDFSGQAIFNVYLGDV